MSCYHPLNILRMYVGNSVIERLEERKIETDENVYKIVENILGNYHSKLINAKNNFEIRDIIEEIYRNAYKQIKKM